ncbi:acylphosphatase [Sphingomonas sp.]
MMMVITTQRVYVSGKVQRVGYRDYVIREAHRLGVTGWVRNLHDGRVEMLIAGGDDVLARFLDACRSGPALARIDNIEAFPENERAPKGFTKRFTA